MRRTDIADAAALCCHQVSGLEEFPPVWPTRRWPLPDWWVLLTRATLVFARGRELLLAPIARWGNITITHPADVSGMAGGGAFPIVDLEASISIGRVTVRRRGQITREEMRRAVRSLKPLAGRDIELTMHPGWLP